jgi:hypothetical protein
MSNTAGPFSQEKGPLEPCRAVGEVAATRPVTAIEVEYNFSVHLRISRRV